MMYIRAALARLPPADYRFLEDANRVKEGSTRDKAKQGPRFLPKKVLE